MDSFTGLMLQPLPRRGWVDPFGPVAAYGSGTGNPGVTPEIAAFVLAKRPDILAAFASWGWDTSEQNWPAIVEEWWRITAEKAKYNNDFATFLASLGWTGNGATIPGDQLRETLTKWGLALGACWILYVMFFAEK